DVILWAISATDSVGVPRPSFWRLLWRLATQGSDSRQAPLAFVFAACRPGYGRTALAQALGGSGVEGQGPASGLLKLAQAAGAPPTLQAAMSAWLGDGPSREGGSR
ncbi:unnamed protein product, partial [Polarella glacialis]